jgi:hypothetical protein
MLIVGFVLVGSVFAADLRLPQTFTNSRDGFSISFPEGWAAMSAEKLESANKVAEAQHPDWKRPAVHYGYEMTNSTGLAFSPYMIIRVTETSGAPDPKAIQDELEKGGDLPPGVQRDKPTFDEDLNAFLLKYRVSIPGVPQVEGSIAYFLTQRGVLKMFFFAPPTDNGGTGVPIQQIIRNVQIHDGLKFVKPAPPSRVGLVLALLAMIVIVIVLARPRPAKGGAAE